MASNTGAEATSVFFLIAMTMSFFNALVVWFLSIVHAMVIFVMVALWVNKTIVGMVFFYVAWTGGIGATIYEKIKQK